MKTLKESLNESLYTANIMAGPSKASARTLIYSTLVWELVVKKSLENFGYDVIKTSELPNGKSYQAKGIDFIVSGKDIKEIFGKPKITIDFKNCYRKGNIVPISNIKSDVDAYASIIDGVLFLVPAEDIEPGNIDAEEFRAATVRPVSIPREYARLYEKYYNGGSGAKFGHVGSSKNDELIKSILDDEFIADFEDAFGQAPEIKLF